MPPYEAPRWLRDIERFLPLKSQFVLSGNVRDLQAIEVAPNVMAPLGIVPALANALQRQSCVNVVLYDPVAGFQVHQNPSATPPARLCHPKTVETEPRLTSDFISCF